LSLVIEKTNMDEQDGEDFFSILFIHVHLNRKNHHEDHEGKGRRCAWPMESPGGAAQKRI